MNLPINLIWPKITFANYSKKWLLSDEDGKWLPSLQFTDCALHEQHYSPSSKLAFVARAL